MTDLIINHTTDTNLTRDTGLVHATDALKTTIPPTTHTTNAIFATTGLKTHSTDAIISQNLGVTHATDSFKLTPTLTAPVTSQPTGAVLGGAAALSTPVGQPELSKNASTYLEIGSGLSVLIGLPRIPTWNTAGRPKNPKAGTIGFNSQTQSLEFWEGNFWTAMPMDQIKN